MDPSIIRRAPSLPRRAAAIIYDLMLLVATLFCTALLYTAVMVTLDGNISQPGEVSTGSVITELQPVNLGAAFLPTLVLVAFTFYTYFWWRGGQTLGMRVWRLRLVRDDGSPLGFMDCARRLALAVILSLLFGAGYIYLLFNGERRTLHGKWSKTRIVHEAR